MQVPTRQPSVEDFARYNSPDAEPLSGEMQGSYSNLYDPNQEVPLGGSAHSMTRTAVTGHFTSNNNIQSKTGSQKVHRAGRPSPQIVRQQYGTAGDAAFEQIPRSSSYDAKSIPHNKGMSTFGSLDFDHMSLASDAKYPTVPAMTSDPKIPPPPVSILPGTGAPRPRPAGSSGSSVHSRISHSPALKTRLSPIGSSPSVAIGDDRHVISMDLPQQRPQRSVQSKEHHENGPSGYSSASDSVGTSRRPISFVSALVMSDQLSERELENARQMRARLNSGGGDAYEQNHNLSGSTYEISV